LKDALRQFDRLLLLDPNHPVAHNEKASVLANMNQFDAAFASVDKSLNIDPMYADAHLNKGNLYSETKRYNEALAAYDKALRFKPSLANAWLGRGNVFHRLKRYDEALAAYERALTFDPALAYAWYGRGNVFRDLYRLDEALTNFDKALALEPHFAKAFDRKGRTLLELGRLSEANSAIERAISLEPRAASFYVTLALSKRLAPGDPYVRTMVEFARDMSSLPIEEQIDLHFALAKAFEGNEDHERSFRHLMDGNALKRKQMAYDEATTLGVLERTQAAFTRQLTRSNEGRGDPSSIPVFIFGMPRSGTTLVEQILAGHPKVFGAGEILDFDQAVAGLSGAAREVLNNPEAISLMSGEQLRELGASYVGRIRRAAPETARITNKMPSNFQFAGLIHLALPNARIIHTRRDPVDTCFSCFSTLFHGNMVFTYDMAELGRYYRAYEALMAHWRGVLPQNRMLEVQYEEVVADLEGQTRRILDHCGLEWDARCLNFHETARPVLTASMIQVRQPIYKSSVGRSRDYERFLEPLLAELAPESLAVRAA
jgi:tetratricopeptide (TPR) repeat protein